MVLLLGGCLLLHGQGLPTAKPEAVGLSADRLERIGAAVQRSIQEDRLAGAVTLVARRGRVAWFKAQGLGGLNLLGILESLAYQAIVD